MATDAAAAAAEATTVMKPRLRPQSVVMVAADLDVTAAPTATRTGRMRFRPRDTRCRASQTRENAGKLWMQRCHQLEPTAEAAAAADVRPC